MHYNHAMEICSVCCKNKDNDEYYYRNKNTQKLHTQCKQCYAEKRRATWKSYYHKHGSKYRENAVIRNRRIKNALKKRLLEYLSDKSCVRCGISDPRVLEFDHTDPTSKSYGIARAINSTMTWDNILLEINKCQILCANCHKIKTSKEQLWYKNSA